MLKFKKRTTVPAPGAFYYVHDETRVEIKASSWNSLFAAVRDYHVANDFPIPVDFTQRVEDNAARQTLQRAGPQWVEESGKEWIPLVAVRTWRGVDQVVRGTLAIAHNVIRGGEKVSKEEAERRASICSHCEFNVKPDDCKSCNMGKVEAAIRKVVGNATTTKDAKLNSCWWCGCFLKALIWWPLDILQQWMSNETNAQLPPHCWKKKP